MRSAESILSATIIAAAAIPSTVIAADAVTWQRWETSLTSSKGYSNPFRDVSVDVTYTGPGGQQIKTVGFWDGGNTFKIRAAFPTAGNWSWKVTSSDPDNAGLHNVTGTVNVIEYVGDNPLYRHGNLKVSDNERHLTHADGTPFFYLADTAWLAPQYASVSDWRTFINDRAEKRFSAIQVAPASDWDRNEADPGNALKADYRNVNGDWPFTTTDGKFLARSNLTMWNPAYWQHVDEMVEYANQKGLVLFMNGVMHPAGGAADGAPEAFARALAGRLAGNHVILAPNFDANPWRTNKVADFEKVGQALQQSGPNLVASHPNTSYEPVEKGHAYTWLDVSGVQSGHNNGNRESVFANARQWTREAYDLKPTKPVINLEAFYDASGSGYTTGKYAGTPKDARAAGYLSVLNGSAGYGYGAFGIWNWEPDEKKPYHWKKAINYDSSTQLGYMVELMQAVEWWKLEPRSDAIRNQPTSGTNWRQKVMAFAIADDQRTGVAYLPAGGSIELDMSVFADDIVSARWFDPINNRYTDIDGKFDNEGNAVFSVPGGIADDAVLILKAAVVPEPVAGAVVGGAAIAVGRRHRVQRAER